MKTFVKQISPLDVLEVKSLRVQQPSVISSGLLSLLAALKHRGMQLFESLTQTSDLQVWQTSDAWGKSWWSARDRLTGRSIHRVSEEALRSWIEQRYYQ